jgi:septal ring factor EnvC (AmiA/AmiB activator)
MSAAREHPRLATTITAALAALVVLAVLACGALAGGNAPGRATAAGLRVSDPRLAEVQRELAIAQTDDAQLQAQLGTLEAELACLQRSHRAAHATCARRKR